MKVIGVSGNQGLGDQEIGISVTQAGRFCPGSPGLQISQSRVTG